jgi:hypothetical protein
MPDAQAGVRRKYRVVSPWFYSAASLPGQPEQRFQVIPPDKFVEAVPLEAPIKRRAVWIVHGMGQQLPFETLDALTEGIMRVATPGPNGFDVRARTVQIADQTIQRVELDVFKGDSRIELHLYEAYWAPITEGKVKLSEVITFLLSASSRGLLNAFTISPFTGQCSIKSCLSRFISVWRRKSSLRC